IGVISIPTLILFKNGVFLDQLVGAQYTKAISDKLNSLL
ncbi:thioredoxin family protein, partial [Campylobacter jejuni]|nr:thioredoxin family protein [Campylobacter jejuni]